MEVWMTLFLGLVLAGIVFGWGERPSVPSWTAKRVYLKTIYGLIFLQCLTVMKALGWHEELVQCLRYATHAH